LIKVLKEKKKKPYLGVSIIAMVRFGTEGTHSTMSRSLSRNFSRQRTVDSVA